MNPLPLVAVSLQAQRALASRTATSRDGKVYWCREATTRKLARFGDDASGSPRVVTQLRITLVLGKKPSREVVVRVQEREQHHGDGDDH